ncbi:angiopoietin-related protein 7-like isoform X6 [Drosophila obscura]|uniref:angiopoietin-related protein 7-like isoform X6 n=1 Tax=Drosophila obscura TaxID=7282 RepID=UPI001BB24522|nr:angiopoietin-related protein 7-like isoform X6 [Drosophila obscura]
MKTSGFMVIICLLLLEGNVAEKVTMLDQCTGCFFSALQPLLGLEFQEAADDKNVAKDKIHSLELTISNLQSQLLNSGTEIKNKEEHINDLREQIQGKEEQMNGKDEQIKDLIKQIQGKEEQINGKDEQIKDLSKQIQGKGEQMNGKDEQIKDLIKQIQGKEEQINGKDEQIKDLIKQIQGKDEQMNGKDEQIKDLSKQIQGKEEQINGKDEQIKDLIKQIQGKEEQMNGKDEQIKDLIKQIQGKEEQMNGKDEQIKDLSKQIQGKEEQMNGKDEQIKDLSKQIKEKDEQILLAKIIDQPSQTNPTAENLPDTCPRGCPNGIFQIKVRGIDPFEVPCDTSGWTVIQRRIDGSVDFNRKWEAYKEGFGDMRGEFFIGLEKLHLMTAAQPQELYIELRDVNGTYRHARYDNFSVGSEEENFILKSLGEYSGNAGDSLRIHEGAKFATLDRDIVRCVFRYDGPWWFKRANCGISSLNGIYYEDGTTYKANGIFWGHWTIPADFHISLTFVKITIRPKRPQT